MPLRPFTGLLLEAPGSQLSLWANGLCFVSACLCDLERFGFLGFYSTLAEPSSQACAEDAGHTACENVLGRRSRSERLVLGSSLLTPGLLLLPPLPTLS